MEGRNTKEFKRNVLQEIVDKLNKGLRLVDSMNHFEKINQGKFNNAYSLFVDAKMELEKYIEKMEVENENN